MKVIGSILEACFFDLAHEDVCEKWSERKEVPQSENRTLTRTRYTGARLTTGLPDPQSGLSSDGLKSADPLQQREKTVSADSPLTPFDVTTDHQMSESPQSPGRTSKRSLT
ncbi:unnamed protein product [Schistocephalus solidus]|uniref:PDE4DIP n=1 Tax=Schistocephalus solidus TaxID=70667 RepID=A0A183SNE0_SCHSO|nr:unnamed protein product [Schistocephalus solidus]